LFTITTNLIIEEARAWRLHRCLRIRLLKITGVIVSITRGSTRVKVAEVVGGVGELERQASAVARGGGGNSFD
jgi:hypothetical protein